MTPTTKDTSSPEAPSPTTAFNLKPEVWGPYTWLTLHFFASVYPVYNPSEDTRRAFVDIVRRLQPLLPCQRCSQNYVKELETFPPARYTACRAHVVRFTIALHNSVNKRLGKKVYSVQEAHCVFRELEKQPLYSLRYVWVALMAILIPHKRMSEAGKLPPADWHALQRFWKSVMRYTKLIPQLHVLRHILGRAAHETRTAEAEAEADDGDEDTALAKPSTVQQLYEIVQKGYTLWKHEHMVNASSSFVDHVDQAISKLQSGKGTCSLRETLQRVRQELHARNDSDLYADARKTADQEHVRTCSRETARTTTPTATATAIDTDTHPDDARLDKRLQQMEDSLEDISDEMSAEDREALQKYRNMSDEELQATLRRKQNKVQKNQRWYSTLWAYVLLFIVMVGMVLVLRFMAQRINVNRVTERMLPRGLKGPISQDDNTAKAQDQAQAQAQDQQYERPSTTVTAAESARTADAPPARGQPTTRL